MKHKVNFAWQCRFFAYNHNLVQFNMKAMEHMPKISELILSNYLKVLSFHIFHFVSIDVAVCLLKFVMFKN